MVSLNHLSDLLYWSSAQRSWHQTSLTDPSHAETSHHAVRRRSGSQRLRGPRVGLGCGLWSRSLQVWDPPAETLLYGYEGQCSCIQRLLCVQSSESLLKKAKMRAKRKPRRCSDSSGGYNLSDVIQSPPTAGLLTHAAYHTRLLTVFEQSFTLTVAYTWEYRVIRSLGELF